MFNPFFIVGYGGPEYFCDREKETKKLVNALTNSRNVAFISPRRLGKTALIHHAFNRISTDDPNARCFYIDIFNTQNQAELISLIGSMLYFNPTTNSPELSLTIEEEKSHKSLEEIFSYLNSSGHECYIALDEFQQITYYPEAGTEALLRSLIQFTEHIHFVFAGSQQHLMADMFTSPKRPFYQCCQKMGLEPIPMDTYYEFAARLFKDNNRHLPREIFQKVYSFSKGYTWFIQDVMNRLYGSESEVVDENLLHNVLCDVREEGEVTFKNYCSLFSPGQLRLIKAIAAEDVVIKPFDNSFLLKHKLTAVSSVRQALTTLTRLGVITQSDQGYFLSDRYFSLWLHTPSL